MNDIHEASEKFQAILYADDTNLLATLCSFNTSLDNASDLNTLSENINTELNNIQEWLNINKLSLNVKKTKFMIFHYYQRNINNLIPNLKINGEQIEQVSDFNFLGLTIDQNLNWNSHIQKISHKVARSLGVLNRPKRFLPAGILRTMYNALVLPHLQYSILSWGFKNNRLNKLQKRAIRIITNSKYNAHTEPLLKRLNLLKLDDIFRINVLKLFYKYRSNTLPAYFMNMFSDAVANHDYDIRGHSILHQPRVRTAGGKDCVRYYLPHLLGKTKNDIIEKVNTHSYIGFSKYIKVVTIQSYIASCTLTNCYVCQN